MQRVETLTGQLVLMGGTDQEQSDLITVVEPPSPFSPLVRKGRLYLLAEAGVGADPERVAAACQLVAKVVRQNFYDENSYSLTSALRSAFRAANKALYEQNFQLNNRQRIHLGLSCVVLHESDMFIAQVQPAQAYTITEGRLRALPAHPSWDPAHLSAAPFIRSGALGASLFIEPELYRCTVGVGSTLLLCSSNFAPRLGKTDIESILRETHPAVSIDRLRQIAMTHELGDAHAFMVKLNAGPRPQPRVAPRPARTRQPKNWLRTLFSFAERGSGRPASTGAEDEQRVDTISDMPDQPNLPVNPVPIPQPLDLGPTLREQYAEARTAKREKATLRRENLPPSAFLGEEVGQEKVRQPIDLGDPLIKESGQTYRPSIEYKPLIDMSWGERLSLPFRQFTLAMERGLRTRQLRRPATTPQINMRERGLSYRRTSPPFPWILLLSLVLSIALLIFYGFNVTQANEQQIVLEYFAVADQRLAVVREAADEAAALEALDLASQAIDEVRASPNVTDTNPTLWLRYQELQREYERALAAVQRLNFFDELTVLATHPLPTGQFSSIVVPPTLSGITETAILEGLRYLYAIDADPRNGRLYRFPRDGGEPQVYLSPSQNVGATVVGSVRAALWRTDQVIAIDQAPNGFGYYFQSGGSWNYSKLGASEIWNPRDRLDIEEYGGNLYVWGAQPNELLRFRSGFYGDAPDYWIDPLSTINQDLDRVVDMTVDGSIYLLRSDGTVLIFSQGQLVKEVVPETITPPLSQVRSFAVSGTSSEEGFFFLVDALNSRIVQVEKRSGKVVQQIKADATAPISLDALNFLVVDSSSARPTLYIANGNQILRTSLPAPPRPFRELGNGEE